MRGFVRCGMHAGPGTHVERGSLARAGCGRANLCDHCPEYKFTCVQLLHRLLHQKILVRAAQRCRCVPHLLLAVVAVRARAATVAVVHEAGGGHPDGLQAGKNVSTTHPDISTSGCDTCSGQGSVNSAAACLRVASAHDCSRDCCAITSALPSHLPKMRQAHTRPQSLKCPVEPAE